MLDRIVSASLRFRWVVVLGIGLLSAAGFSALSRLNIDAFPDTTPIQVQINTVATSLVPEEVERLITFPVELALGGLPGLEQIRSISQFGLSQITVTFQDGTDIYFARQLINERLQAVELPPGIARPEMGPVSTGLGEVFHYTLASSKKEDSPSLTALRTTQDWQIRPELRTVAGTAEINSWGGLKKQYQVLLQPENLVKYDLNFQQIVEALQSNNLNVGGGNITRGGDMLLVHGVGRTANLEELRQIVITARDGVPIHLDDVAQITIGHELRRGAVTANGQGEVVLGLGFMRMGANSYSVTQSLSNKLESVKAQLPHGVDVETVYDRTNLVDQVIATVRKNLGEGALLVVAVLFIFLGDLRAGLIVASAIPLSLLFAFCGMSQVGIAGSLLSLGALDFGLVVDGSVVTIENVVRRLSEQKKHASRQEVVRQACSEVAKPSLFGVLIIMIVYLPILALEGVEGKMFRPMALTVIFALAGSVVLSLTVIPVLANWFLPKQVSDHHPLVVRIFARMYEPLLRAAMDRPMFVLSATGIALTIALAIAIRLGGEFVPRLNEGSLVIGILRPPGTSLEESIEINTRLEQALLKEFPDEIDHLWSRQGAPEVATDPGTIESTDVFIALHPRSHWKKATSQEELVELLSETVKTFPGQTVWFTQPIEMRINEMLSGVRADVAIKVFGPDLEKLIDVGGQMENALRKVPGCSELTVEQIKGQPVLRIKIDQGQIARYGIPAQSVLDVVESIGGKVVGEVVEDQLRFPLTVRLPESLRQSPATIAGITFTSASGERVPLSRLASIEEVRGARVISREQGMRRLTLQCNVRGRDLAGFVQDCQQKIASGVTLPEGGYRVEWGGQFENFQRASARLQLVVPVAMLLIIGMLYLTFRNMFDALLVFTSVPFACIGGVLTLSLRHMPFSISAAVGFIALSGISVLNSLVLVEFIRHLRHEGRDLRSAIVEAGLTRMRPVLMTALVASLGFVPMALSTGMGAEVQRPLASVVIGGVITSSFMTLVVLPTLYAICAESLEAVKLRLPHAEPLPHPVAT